MNQDYPYKILAFYLFTPIQDPHLEVLKQKTFCEGRDIASRIYISEQGINGQLSASVGDAQAYMAWLKSRPEFSEIEFKTDDWHEHAFPRLAIKYRAQLVALDDGYDIKKTGEHVPPVKWKEMLESGEAKVLIDVRNDYEWKVGRFKEAETPQCGSFREFKQYAEQLQKSIDPYTTPVMMYCTGGIRCEAYSAYLRQKGFKKVYQLQGGIINYGKQIGGDHWLGKLFVFDDRMTVPISNAPTETIGTCHYCRNETDAYYNCANMDCNTLFLCCADCLKTYSGCCRELCKDAPRVRPYHQQNPHKPFRKWYHYFKGKTKQIV